jgi:spoIIIJ-associated protein
MAEQLRSIELDIPADDVESAVSRVCADWGLDRADVQVDAGQSEGAMVHLRITQRDLAARLPDEELEQARHTLGELLALMDIHAEVDADWGAADEVTGVRPMMLDVRGDDLAMLLARHGEALEALQYMTRLILSKQSGRAMDLIVDVEGHKRRREQQLRRMARRMADQAVERQRTMALEPMTAYERRIIHLELRDHPAVRTESVGEGRQRKVTIVPR